jgi:hypothetical protein
MSSTKKCNHGGRIIEAIYPFEHTAVCYPPIRVCINCGFYEYGPKYEILTNNDNIIIKSYREALNVKR